MAREESMGTAEATMAIEETIPNLSTQQAIRVGEQEAFPVISVHGARSSLSMGPLACDPTSCSHEQDIHEETSLLKSEPKHKIFLSHSGARKPFVKLLCGELEAENYSTFFDQRDDCLPKGEEFKSRLFEAARKCQVGVVVLSKEYLSSYWPMVELVQFVRAIGSENKDMKLLPLFFETKVDDLSSNSIEKWRSEWMKLVREGDDVEEWANAVRKLKGWSGVKFDDYSGMDAEVKYRDAIVKFIFGLTPPDLLYDTSKIVGCDRIRKILEGKFVYHTGTNAQVLDLYGMGGLGKTTMSKALYNHFIQPYFGRACIIEFKEGMTALDRLHMVMRKLLKSSKNSLKEVSNESQGWGVLGSDRMKERRVFLVIDNVDDQSKEEVRNYLNVKYGLGSKIMVTSRSHLVVEELLESDPRYCYEIPRLESDEAARVLFQQVVPAREYSSLGEDERNSLERCATEACFSDRGSRQANFHGDESSDIHPMSVIALGVYIRSKSKTSDLLTWNDHLPDYAKLKGSIRPYDRILSLLGLPFNDLDRVTKLMFLDICLYASKALESPMLSNSLFEDMRYWLATVHEVPIEVVESKISDLKRSAMINEEGENIFIHDLYKEYATWYLGQLNRADELLGVWCVRQHKDRENFLPYELRRTPPGRCWPELKRIRLENISCYGFSMGKVREWCNVVVLQIVGCKKLTTINLQGFTCLRHLELKDLRGLKTLIFTEEGNSSTSSMSQEPYPELAQPQPLQFVTVDSLSSLELLPSFSPFTSLKFLRIVDCLGLTQPPSVQRCSGLERMWLEWYPSQKTLPSLEGLTSLRDLTIKGSGYKTYEGEALTLEGLSSLISLGALELHNIPVGDLSGLEILTCVEYIYLQDMHHVTCLPSLFNLARSSLHVLEVNGDKKVRLEGLNELKLFMKSKLEGLALRGEIVPHTPSKIGLWRRGLPVIKLHVHLCCEACSRRVRKNIEKLDGVEKGGVICDIYSNMVTVTATIKPETVLRQARKVKKGAKMWPQMKND